MHSAAVNTLWHRLLRNHAARFVLSSGSGFCVDVVAFYLINGGLSKHHNYLMETYNVSSYSLSLAVSFFLGVVVNFIMTRYIVFTESRLPLHKQFFRFCSVAIVGYFANLYLLKMFINLLGIDPTSARIMAALSLFFASFFVHKAFSFSLSLRKHMHSDED